MVCGAFSTARNAPMFRPMALDIGWQNFRRMQDTVATVAGLAYAGLALEGWRAFHAPETFKLERLVILPGALALCALAGALLIGPLRRALMRHLWVSYRTGFGQTAISVLGGVGVLIVLALLSLWPLLFPDKTGPHLGSGFSAYGAGIGLLWAEAILVRRLEADPVLRSQIEVPDPPPN